MRQRDLAIRLSRIPPHPDPVPGLEQYATPSDVAADLLYRALGRGDIAHRRVVDLGSGTGILAIGASLLGAAEVVGLEIDATAVAHAEAAAAALGATSRFLTQRVEDATGTWDTVVMNPPFGAQWAQRGADVRFLEVALRLAPIGYSLHAAKTRPHLAQWLAARRASTELLTTYAFPLPHQFAFHRKEKVHIDVDLLRWQRMG